MEDRWLQLWMEIEFGRRILLFVGVCLASGVVAGAVSFFLGLQGTMTTLIAVVIGFMVATTVLARRRPPENEDQGSE